jgi:hypothetical protein
MGLRAGTMQPVARSRTALLASLLALAAGGVTAGAANPSHPAALPGLMVGSAPWGPNNGLYLRQRLKAIGLHALSREGVVVHIHEHLDLVVNGRVLRPGLPAYVGINFDAPFIAELHTHDTSGIIHVESPTVRTFMLGDFFDVWGLRFSSRCLGGYCANGEKRVWAFVNGRRIVTDPRKIVLRGHQEIVVAFGTFASIPKPIPTAYPFPQGY